jgi:hypothetical protein
VTDNTTGSSAPAGWYPVSDGSSQLRWWDGTRWTDSVLGVGAPRPQAPAPIPRAPEGTNPNTVWGWLVPVSLVVDLVMLVPLSFYFNDILSSGFASPDAVIRATFGPSYFAILGLGLLQLALVVVFAALDWRGLKANGVPRPFHWAFAFLSGGVVYIIGRSVVLRRRTGGGLGPLWLYIALYVVILIATLILTLDFVITLSSQITDYTLQGANA